MTTLSAPSLEQVQRFVDALIASDRQACESINASALDAGVPPLVLYQRLYQPALYQIGELWATNQLPVSTEQMATAIVESLMNEVYSRLANVERRGRRVLLATVENELHQVGLKMTADVFELHGWDTSILPAGSPTDVLLDAIDRESPDAVGLSCSVVSHADTLLRMLERLRRHHPDVPILVGGQAVVASQAELVPAHLNVNALLTIDQLEAWLEDQPHT